LAENQIHTEDALFDAGASSAFYEIVGASYSPADAAAGKPATATATIDLSTVDHTGCLLTHNYATGETALKWDKEDPLGPDMFGTADDVDVAIEDITRGRSNRLELFEAFQALILAASSGTSSGRGQ
jgi:hypothetical protein